MVDSADRERMTEARQELFGILDSDEMRGVPVVVIANKQDLPGKILLLTYYLTELVFVFVSNISRVFHKMQCINHFR